MATQSTGSSSSPFHHYNEINVIEQIEINEQITMEEQGATISKDMQITDGSTNNLTSTNNRGTEPEFDICGSLFGVRKKTEDDMYKLYCAHARAKGFSVRKSTSRVRDNGKLYDRYYVCSNEGIRKPKKSKVQVDSDGETEKQRKNHLVRTGCSATMRIKLSQDGDYEVVTHVTNHNHELTIPILSHLHRSQRKITTEKGKAIEEMLNSGIKATDSFRYMVNEAGGDDCVGHTMRDHINYANRLKMKEQENGDAQRLVELLYQQQSEENDFFFRVMLDESGRLGAIFWRDSLMKEDYMIFGDVMVFDTTYSTNKYGMICAPIVGMNNHRNNVMFGCAFLSNEETKSFDWLFDVFKKSMGGKSPISIFTDQDQAMTNAISTV